MKELFANNRFRKRFKIFYVVLISILFIYFFKSFFNLNFGIFLASFKTISVHFVLLAVLLGWSEVFLRIFRFNEIIKFYGYNTGIKKLIPIFFAGFFLGSSTPMRMGEPIKAVFLKKREGVPLTVGGISTIIERVLDLLMLLTVLFISIFFIGYKNLATNSGIIFILFLFFLIVYSFFSLGLFQRKILYFTNLLLVKIHSERIKILLEAINIFFSELGKKNPKKRVQISFEWVLISIIILFVDSAIFVILFMAFQCNMAISKVFFVLALSTLVGLISQTPGGIVTTEGSSIFLFTELGASPEISLGVTIMARLMGYYAFSLVGFLFAVKEGKS